MPNKEDFYSSLNIEVATDVDYRGEKIIYKELKMNNLDNYHKLYVQSDTLWLTDVFENFKNKNFEIYELYPVNSICLWSSIASIFKETRKKIRTIKW